MTEASAAPLQQVWPWPVRLAHWTLATLVLINLFDESGDALHRWLGYAAAATAVLRLGYGLWQRGTPSGLEWPSLRLAWRHLRAMTRGRVPRVAGHNPLAQWMTLSLWTLVLLLALSGWVSRRDRFWGEDWPLLIHESLVWALQICIVVHLAGVVLSSVLERQNLLRAMISGRKRVDSR